MDVFFFFFFLIPLFPFVFDVTSSFVLGVAGLGLIWLRWLKWVGDVCSWWESGPRDDVAGLLRVGEDVEWERWGPSLV